MEKKLANAFSIQMLNFDNRDEITIKIRKIERPANLNEFDSCIGHADTANVLGVKCDRKAIKLNPDDELVIAQVTGQRLPEGATTLPEGCVLTFFEVKEV